MGVDVEECLIIPTVPGWSCVRASVHRNTWAHGRRARRAEGRAVAEQARPRVTPGAHPDALPTLSSQNDEPAVSVTPPPLLSAAFRVIGETHTISTGTGATRGHVRLTLTACADRPMFLQFLALLRQRLLMVLPSLEATGPPLP